ncbi:G1/S-specific cyclin pas1 [Wickerhamiella sorbophila]|uniref:G1/S-specific cyclin pas1 n=1 Tax=Wickerhamiella sorbophila TaxID=45607 RepID=A0A2T0FKG7_9ASCO|nr:G1/S-specific cyclin pas1 [Wickerhamiella sorbophila]PRT55472.1 G1/S-specific cyclin pas1 [Wickerhamiella sorbophila]
MAFAKRSIDKVSKSPVVAPNFDKSLYNRCYNFASLTCLLCYNPSNLIAGPDGRPLCPSEAIYELARESAPKPAFLSYTIRLISHSKVSPHTLTLALHYIYRFRTLHGKLDNYHTGSEYILLVTALMIANKLHEDVSYTTRSWATMSQIPAAELTRAEKTFLCVLDYDLVMSKHKWNLWQYDLTALLRLHGQFRTLASRSNLHSLPPQMHLGIAASPMACVAK